MRSCSNNLLRRWHWRGCQAHSSLSPATARSRGVGTTTAATTAQPSIASPQPIDRTVESLSSSGLSAPSATPQLSTPATAPSPPPQLPGSHSAPSFIPGQLTRDFISASLYSASSGYFNTSNRIYTSPSPSALDFSTLASRDAYYQRLTVLYDQFDDCWLTPVELFKPHYAHSIARWILQQERQQQPDDLPTTNTLRIVEVGGGNGTCAAGILDYLRDKQPVLYRNTHYTIVDFSTTNRQRQLTSLATHLTQPANTASTAAPRVELLTMSMLDWSELIEQRVYVLGLEVLDNMPHDKVIQHNNQSYQTHVHSLHSLPPPTTATAPPPPPPADTEDPNQRYQESYSPLSDPFIHEYLTYQSQYAASPPPPVRHSYGSLGNAVAVWLAAAGERLGGLVRRRGAEEAMWVPSTALLLFHTLHHFLPRHRVLLADFSSLPDTIGGLNAPIVSGREVVGGGTAAAATGSEGGSSRRGRAKDYGTYLIDLGLADIFFPTDFELLQFVYNSVRTVRATRDNRTLSQHSPRVLTNYEFMHQYAVEEAEREWVAEGKVGRWRSPTQTRGKFDPLLHDYVNVKFLVS